MQKKQTVKSNQVKKQKVSEFQVVLKVNDKSESYRLPEKLFNEIKMSIEPYRSKCPPLKAIKCIETGEVFRCSRDAMKWLFKEGKTNNYNADILIKAACKRERNIYSGYHWEFANKKNNRNIN